MPRKAIVRSNSHYYHVTARANNRENFHLPLDQVWELCVQELSHLQKEFEVIIGAFVLMSNHFHLLILTPSVDIDRVMYFFMKRLTLKIQKRSGRINKIFGGRYKGSLIENERYLLNVYKYIYRNPVASGVAEKAQDYVYSTLFYKCIQASSLKLKVSVLVEVSTSLEWINESFNPSAIESMGKGLKKTVFSYISDRSTGKAIVP